MLGILGREVGRGFGEFCFCVIGWDDWGNGNRSMKAYTLGCLSFFFFFGSVIFLVRLNFAGKEKK